MIFKTLPIADILLPSISTKAVDDFNIVDLVFFFGDSCIAAEHIPSIGIKYKWFPIDENAPWGYAPFYFVLHNILDLAERIEPHESVILMTCHGGVNRSVVMAEFCRRVLPGHFCAQVHHTKAVDGGRVIEHNKLLNLIPQNIEDFGRCVIAYPMFTLSEVLKHMR